MLSSRRGQKKDFVIIVMGNLAMFIHKPINNSKSLFWEKEKMKKSKGKRRQDMRNNCKVFSYPCTIC